MAIGPFGAIGTLAPPRVAVVCRTGFEPAPAPTQCTEDSAATLALMTTWTLRRATRRCAHVCFTLKLGKIIMH